MFQHRMTLVAQTEEKPEAVSKPAAVAVAEEIPPCPVCDCGAPAIYTSASACCRQYLRNWDEFNRAG
ncbi:MAG: hypothetical protein ABSC64_20240 [Candidatus Korobacteraceae bacterium]